MKEQTKTPEKELSDKAIDKLLPCLVGCRVQNTGNQDTHRID